jgi:hypothetical protein
MKRIWIVFMLIVLWASACSPISFVLGTGKGSSQGSADASLEGYFLPDPSIGLDTLQSFSQSLSISFTGTQDGNTLAFTDSYHQDLNRERNTQFTISDITNSEGIQEKIIGGNAGEAYYSKVGDDKCQVSWGDRAEGIEPFVPAKLLPPLLAANEAGLEEINGVQTRRYEFNTVSLDYPSNTAVDGQVWLAEGGGYVVKFTMHIQDDDGYFGEGVKGEQVYDYELSQINALSGPELPEGCMAVLTDFPAMPDAVDLQRLPGVLAYTSSSDVSQIQGYYEQELTGQGWTLGSSYLLKEGGANLVFQQVEENKIAYISLQEAGTDIWVTVQVQPLVEQ